MGGVVRTLDRLRLAMANSKRTIGRLVVGSVPGCPPDVSHLFVVHAVEQGPGAQHEEVTVGLVAGRLGVDPSHASRLVAAAIRSGLVRRVASQEDGRRSRLELTSLGQRLAEAARRFRWDMVQGAMAGWSEAERVEFARLFDLFTEGLLGVIGSGGAGSAGPGCAGHAPVSDRAGTGRDPVT